MLVELILFPLWLVLVSKTDENHSVNFISDEVFLWMIIQSLKQQPWLV